MCNKLLQTYACGHSKPICLTPCTQALKSAPSTSPSTSHAATHPLARSDSTVSALALTEGRTHERPNGIQRPNSPAVPSPLRTGSAASQQRNAGTVPAFRFVPPPASSASQTSSASSVSPVSPSFPNTPLPSSAQHPPPYKSTATATPTPSASSASQVPHHPEPKFCAYYIPHRLTTSKHPCIECYARPEWEALRARWMESYRLGHPLGRVGDVEGLSGVMGVMEGWRGGG